VAEAIDLRNKPYVADWRSCMKRWAHHFAAGNTAGASKVRREIALVSKGFKSAKWASRVSGIVTYMAIPLLLADAMLGGVIGIPAGIVSAVVGTASQAIGDLGQRKYGWIMIGSR